MDENDRRSIRLPDFAYDQGGFFLTLCSASRTPRFGYISEDEVLLTRVGEILKEEWLLSARIRPQVKLDAWVIMPNHFHAIVWLERVGSAAPSGIDVGAHACPERSRRGSAPLQKIKLHREPRSLGSFMAEFKASVSSRVHGLEGMERIKVWQRGYFERVIRDDRDLQATRRYIIENPLRWQEDHLYQ
jgi:REP element-mobilizing transposase RayT